MRGFKVGNLQAALRFLLDKAAIMPNDAMGRRKLSAGIALEQTDQFYGDFTRDTVTAFQSERHLKVNGSVDKATADALNRLIDELTSEDHIDSLFTVQGTVRKHGGTPVIGVTVTAFDRDLRNEQPLGKILTDRNGFYRIEYFRHQFVRAEKDSADLVVKILSHEGTVLFTSPILFNAPPVATVDLRLPAGLFEPATLFESIRMTLLPLLEGVKVQELEENEQHQDLTFLSGETGIDRPTLARFALAHRLERHGIQAEFWFVLLGGSFHHYDETQSLAEQLSDIFEKLPSLDANAVRKAINRGFRQKEIEESFLEKVQEWIEDFFKLIARRSVREENKSNLIRPALEDAGITDFSKQEKFGRLMNEYGMFTPEVSAALEKDSSFVKEEIADLQTSFELHALTRGDFTPVSMLKSEFDIRQPEKVRTLAKMSENDWVKLVKTKHLEGKINLPVEVQVIANEGNIPEAEIYGKELAGRFREAFPTTAFTGGLERALQNGGAGGLRRPDILLRFLNRHENFELLSTSVDDFLRNQVHHDFQALAQDEEFRREIKAVQRLFKLVPTFEATDGLLADNLHSAQKIYRMGPTEFVRRYSTRPGFTPDMARLAWNRAAETHAAVLTIVGDLNGLEAETLPMVLKNNNQLVSQFPNWNNLFRTGDLCDCEHCRSVLSPAAYFADLLLFLKDRDTRTGKGSARDVLFQRRPDLGFLELNCENALTPLPYIDLVCEVLESAVDTTGENDLELSGFTNIPADTDTARTDILQAFAGALADTNTVNDGKQKIALGAGFTFSPIDPSDPNEWVVHSDDVTYLLKKKPPAPHFFAEILPNTKTDAAELRAYPQYVNPRVYHRLKGERFPSNLPFDLFAEEVRAGFHKSNLERWDLMQTLHGTSEPNNAGIGRIAAEYFGISIDDTPDSEFDEMRLILLEDTTIEGQQILWGESGGDWLNRVGNVRNFLQKTNLGFNELLALLDLRFINPNGDIVIHHVDASCDTDQKVIQFLNPQWLDRIHRFLRLWRKLEGWKMWELDLVIRRIGNGLLNEAFLIDLFYFSQVRDRLGGKVTVERVCALFDDLNTETRFTRLHGKREDAIYQNLFLNRLLLNPLDPAFEIDTGTSDLPAGERVNDPVHMSVVLAALGLSETDLTLLLGLTRATDGSLYIEDPPQLTLENLSFLWRHAWLSRQLKFTVEEWKTVLKIFQQDLFRFTNPQSALTFIIKTDQSKEAGFSPDELNWLLAADRSAKAALKESDAARFLLALRKELQEIQSEFNPDDEERYPVLRFPPTDVEGLNVLLASLLKKLNRDETTTSDFLKTLKGGVVLESVVEGLPDGFEFPVTITGAPNHIPVEYDQENGGLRFRGVMTETQRSVMVGNALPVAITENASYNIAIEDLFRQSQTAGENFVSVNLEVELANGVIMPADRPSIPIRYNSASHRLSFIGVMDDSERLSLSAAGNPAAAIDELFRIPRLMVKFFEPVFTVPLEVLPPTIDFKSQLAADLAAKISYDSEQRLLRFAGIMSTAEQAALNALVTDDIPAGTAYHAAVNSLIIQPQAVLPPDSRIWVTEDDLDQANGTLASRMAGVARKALVYLSETFASTAVIQKSSEQLGLTVALTRQMMEGFAIMPPAAPDPANTSLLVHLTRSFASTTQVVNYATQKTTFDGWFWANRVAIILKKWKISFTDLEKLTALTDGSQLLDFLSFPTDDSGDMVSLDRYLRTSRVLRMRDSFPETGISFLEILERLNSGYYAVAAAADPMITEQGLFAKDVEMVNESWTAFEMESLIDKLDLVFPGDYLLAESWERLQRAFYFLHNLNAGADTAAFFAAPAMGPEHAKTLKELFRARFGEETWLQLSTEIQDTLRERKRDALATYLLSLPQPVDAPGEKWENTNDLYAYYLLDTEMSSCQLTSRLVQGSGSIQLFVQRCFMGLEPAVIVHADGVDGDSAWRWWKWMRKYRVWEANRKVFLWPENWIEPELKKDRSPFFKDLENELLQSEITQYSVETAYINYLEKLEGVAQLEVAGFYQEDDGDNTIIHVFGRTKGAEPHLYFYRHYDYRQWSPWERVDLDIQGDYLIPAVINRRLFLFWPVFTEIPDETENTGPVPIPGGGDTQADIKPTTKKLGLQMAVSDYQQGKWSPKRISIDMFESEPFQVEIIKKHYQFFAIDGTEIDDRFVVKFGGYSSTSNPDSAFAIFPFSWSSGAFEITGCRGVPEGTTHQGMFVHVNRPEFESVGAPPVFLKWVELQNRHDGDQDFALDFTIVTPVLKHTPWIFKMTPPWHLSYFDRLLLNGRLWSQSTAALNRPPFTVGIWLPFFYNDKKRTFFVLPAYRQRPTRDSGASQESIKMYYPEIKKLARRMENDFKTQVREWANGIVPALTPEQRQQWEQSFHLQFGDLIPPLGEVSPSYTDEQLADFVTRWFMRFYHFFLGNLAFWFFHFRVFHFKNFYHPFVCDFAKLVYNPLKGIPALLNRKTQMQNSGFSFRQSYQPTPLVVHPGTEEFYPKEDVDFTPDGAYSSYNWELFFHAPLLIANALSKNQRFEEAREWYHFIFNPIGMGSTVPGGSPMSKYWITKPFFMTTQEDYIQQRIDNILRMLAGDMSIQGTATREDLEKQVEDWRTNPFEPHRIASYRTVAYQKTVIMKYLDNLIAWGDNLFRQDSMESINEAAQLYVLAAEILGPHPKKIPPHARVSVESINELETRLDDFGNALAEMENLIPMLAGNGFEGDEDQPPLPGLYFCVPQNDKLLGYWDTVADRLYKIRHCMNIEGVVRQLSLFEPPIDPGALVKAVAVGMDISSALADLNAPLPFYRFNVMLQKANELCNDVKTLGGALLSALEKKDAEALSLLRQGQEVRLLEAIKSLREKQINEAKENLEVLKKSKSVVETRRDYYRNIEKITGGEQLSLDLLETAHKHQNKAQKINIAASVLGYLPNITVGASGFGGSPHVNFQWGTGNIISALQAAAGSETQFANIATYDANRASTFAGYDRRFSDWQLQERLAEKEIEQIDKSVSAAEMRITLAEKELENHVVQIENAKVTDTFMRSKYTNAELYQWQMGQISGVYFQSYQLAYDLAKRAERCFRFELGLQDSSYISFGYWDSLRKGLLSGEKLQYDLRRLETAYLEHNRREFELTRHVSLALLDPMALIKLRETGRCFIHLAEEIFDLDYPGHYFRRIKSVSITLPCVVGPYTSISCTLRLLKNSIRINTANGDNPEGPYPRNVDDQGLPADDSRFVENNVPVKAIATSRAQNDSGIFDLGFRDDRYLPFEGAGVISQWSIELFNDSDADFGKPLRQFDYGTISDAILHVSYTAREDTGNFKNGVVAHLRRYYGADENTPSFRMFSLRHEFPSQWHRFLHPQNPENGNLFELEMSPHRFHMLDLGKILNVNTIMVLARCRGDGNYSVLLTPPLPEPPPDGSNTFTLARVNQFGGLHFGQKDVSASDVQVVHTDTPLIWRLIMMRSDGQHLQPDPTTGIMEVEDIFLVLLYGRE